MPPARASSGPTTVSPICCSWAKAIRRSISPTIFFALGYGGIDADIDAFGEGGHAGIAGGRVEFVDALALRQLPHEGVFAPPFADD